uniref:Uncharacterized protein n=1 Tax=Naja naja TaxID=35670 RepID=A0A8C6X9V2_NAJNA
MAGDITYADLRFARSPPEKSQGEGRGQPGWEPNEGELTYENLQVSRDLQKEVAECGPLKSVPELPCWATSSPFSGGETFGFIQGKQQKQQKSFSPTNSARMESL